MKKASVILIVLLVLSCGQQAEKKAMSEYEAGVYQETLDKVRLSCYSKKLLTGLKFNSVKI